MNILGIDFGTKNIGLAWVDTAIGAVLPYGRLNNKEIEKLKKIIKEDRIEKLIIGLPIDLRGGKENKNTERIRAFGDDLENTTGTAVEYMNEMFSSQQADRMGDGVSRDEKSAMIILEDYIQKMSK